VSRAGAGLDLTNDRLCQLVAAVADGDREAFAQLFRYFAPRLSVCDAALMSRPPRNWLRRRC
jgi:hypothetical protein